MNQVAFREYLRSPFHWLLLLLWARDPLWDFITGLSLRIPLINMFYESIIPIVIVFLIICSARKILSVVKLKDFVFVVVVAAFFYLNYIFFPQNQQALDEYSTTFVWAVLPYFLFGLLINIESDDWPFYVVSILSIATQFVYLFFLGKGNVVGNESDDMIMMAYNLLPHVLMVLRHVLQKATLFNISFFAVGIFMMLSMANRGSIFCTILFIAFYLLFFKRYKKPILARIIIVAIAAIVLPKTGTVVSASAILFSRIGINTRVFDKFLGNEFFISEGRSDIFDVIIPKIMEDPFSMHGLAAERNYGIIYSHNIAVELCLAFGVVIGLLLMAVILLICWKAIRASESEQESTFILQLMTTGLLALFFSGTFLSTPAFFLMLGYCTSVIRKNKSLTQSVTV